MTDPAHDSRSYDGPAPASQFCYAEHARIWERLSTSETRLEGLVSKCMAIDVALVRYDKQWFDLTMRFESMNTQTAARELKLAETMTQMRMGIDSLHEKIETLKKLPVVILSTTVGLSVVIGAMWAVGKYFIKANLP